MGSTKEAEMYDLPIGKTMYKTRTREVHSELKGSKVEFGDAMETILEKKVNSKLLKEPSTVLAPSLKYRSTSNAGMQNPKL